MSVRPIKVKVTPKPEVKTVVKNLDARRRKLVGVGKPGQGLPLFHKKASIMLDRWVQRNFKTEGGLLHSGKWEPFALGGRAVEKKKANAQSIARGFQTLQGQMRGAIWIDGTAKLLQDTGLLRASHQPFHSRRNAGVGTTLPYSKAHNEGKGALPIRRTVPKDLEVRDALKALLNQHAKAAT